MHLGYTASLIKSLGAVAKSRSTVTKAAATDDLAGHLFAPNLKDHIRHLRVKLELQVVQSLPAIACLAGMDHSLSDLVGPLS
jgi:hypothetical protein